MHTIKAVAAALLPENRQYRTVSVQNGIQYRTVSIEQKTGNTASAGQGEGGVLSPARSCVRCSASRTAVWKNINKLKERISYRGGDQ